MKKDGSGKPAKPAPAVRKGSGGSQKPATTGNKSGTPKGGKGNVGKRGMGGEAC